MYEPKATGWASVVVNEFVSLQLIASSPLVDWFVSISYDDFDSSLYSASEALLSEPFSFFTSRLPTVTATSIAAYLAWVVFQALLYVFVPGPLHQAPRTPGGRRLLYRLNGFRAWALTLALAACVCYAGLVDPALIAKHWTATLATAVLYSSALIGIFWVKARVAPDDKGDTLLTGKFSKLLDLLSSDHHPAHSVVFIVVTLLTKYVGHFWYDLFNGGELHPRTGKLFDWKHFNASRTGGILAWTLMYEANSLRKHVVPLCSLIHSDLSFAALQHQRFGSVTNSMVLAVGFRAVIVAEYFLYEDL
jgi:7-dehydrocholesterol reductase